MHMSRTAVVTVNYNSKSDTIACVKSLLRSTIVPPLIIIDNGSVEPFSKNDLPHCPNLHFLRSEENLGFARGNNLGIRWVLSNTHCEYIFLLNNDTKVRSDTIEILEQIMDQSPKTGITAPRILRMDNPKLLWFGGGTVNWYRGAGKPHGVPGPSDTSNALASRNITFASGCAMLVRRALFEEIGGFDKRFFLYEEDLEFCLRAIETGWTIRYVPEAVVLHRIHGSAGHSGADALPAQHPGNPNLAFYMKNMITNRLLNMSIHAKGFHAFQFLIGFPLFFTFDCVRYFTSRRYDAIFAMLQGILEFIKIRRITFENELQQAGIDQRNKE